MSGAWVWENCKEDVESHQSSPRQKRRDVRGVFTKKDANGVTKKKRH